jgi:hypothetical protein
MVKIEHKKRKTKGTLEAWVEGRDGENICSYADEYLDSGCVALPTNFNLFELEATCLSDLQV